MSCLARLVIRAAARFRHGASRLGCLFPPFVLIRLIPSYQRGFSHRPAKRRKQRFRCRLSRGVDPGHSACRPYTQSPCPDARPPHMSSAAAAAEGVCVRTETTPESTARSAPGSMRVRGVRNKRCNQQVRTLSPKGQKQEEIFGAGGGGQRNYEELYLVGASPVGQVDGRQQPTWQTQLAAEAGRTFLRSLSLGEMLSGGVGGGGGGGGGVLATGAVDVRSAWTRAGFASESKRRRRVPGPFARLGRFRFVLGRRGGILPYRLNAF